MNDALTDLVTEDPLAKANLTNEERQIWQDTRSALIIAREENAQLQERLQKIEQANPSDGFVQTVLTRPEFNREVARMLAFDERYGGTSSVLYFDIENLPDIHRACGREVADKIVRTICDTLARHIRNSDILGRLATDEFGVLLSRCENENAWKKGETLSDMLTENIRRIHGCTVEPVVNYGAYTFREKENVATGLQEAARAMTHQRENGPPAPTP